MNLIDNWFSFFVVRMLVNLEEKCARFLIWNQNSYRMNGWLSVDKREGVKKVTVNEFYIRDLYENSLKK